MTNKINWQKLKNTVYQLNDKETVLTSHEIKQLMLALDSAEHDELELEELKNTEIEYEVEYMAPIELLDKELTRLHTTYGNIPTLCIEGDLVLRLISDMHDLLAKYVDDEVGDE